MGNGSCIRGKTNSQVYRFDFSFSALNFAFESWNGRRCGARIHTLTYGIVYFPGKTICKHKSFRCIRQIICRAKKSRRSITVLILVLLLLLLLFFSLYSRLPCVITVSCCWRKFLSDGSFFQVFLPIVLNTAPTTWFFNIFSSFAHSQRIHEFTNRRQQSPMNRSEKRMHGTLTNLTTFWYRKKGMKSFTSIVCTVWTKQEEKHRETVRYTVNPHPNECWVKLRKTNAIVISCRSSAYVCWLYIRAVDAKAHD